MLNSIVPTSPAMDIMTPSTAFMASQVAPRLQRRISARWKRWEPWVLVDVGRRRFDSATKSAELTRFQRRHSEFLFRLIGAGLHMRVIRRHSLDDPRIGDDLRAVLVQAAIERRRTACPPEQPDLSDRRTWEKHSRDAAVAEFLRKVDSPAPPQVPQGVRTSLENRTTIETVQRYVTMRFKLLPQDLQAPSNRRVFVFPRQVAMYLAKQLTTSSLAEIGRQFGGKHHSTVLHSINRIHEMRRSDQHVDAIVKRLTEALSGRRLTRAG